MRSLWRRVQQWDVSTDYNIAAFGLPFSYLYLLRHDITRISLTVDSTFSCFCWCWFCYSQSILDGLPGESNAFFQEDCPEIQIAITFQMVWSMITNAFLVSFFFSLLSKSETRSIQLIFSSKLCINLIDGKVCTNVRCYDLDSSFPLVECHARMYLIDHKMKFHPLRLLEPDDDLGGVLYPSAPTSIIHHIDHHSGK